MRPRMWVNTPGGEVEVPVDFQCLLRPGLIEKHRPLSMCAGLSEEETQIAIMRARVDQMEEALRAKRARVEAAMRWVESGDIRDIVAGANLIGTFRPTGPVETLGMVLHAETSEEPRHLDCGDTMVFTCRFEEVSQ
jgi:hypothetical protein